MRLFGINVDCASIILSIFDLFLAFLIISMICAAFPIGDKPIGFEGLMALTYVGGLAALDGYSVDKRRHLTRTLTRMVAAGMFAMLAFFGAQSLQVNLTDGVEAAPILLLALVVAIFLGCLARAIGLRLHAIRQGLKPKVLVIGSGARAGRLIDMLGNEYQDHIAAFLPSQPPNAKDCHELRVPVEKVIIQHSSVMEIVKKLYVRTIVRAEEMNHAGTYYREIEDVRAKNIEVLSDSAFFERMTGRVDLSDSRLEEIINKKGQENCQGRQLVKRSFDLMLSIVMLVITIPIITIAALTIKLTSPGPVLFRQPRVGRGGKCFQIIKLRTMEHSARRHLERRFAVKNDRRITPVGRVLRRTRIDELPQLFNVFKGDMSLVGPRPEQPGEGFVDRFKSEIPFYDLRHLVRPGLTGWAQVKFGYCGDDLSHHVIKTSYDLFYVKNQSTFFDLMILAKTANAVLFGDANQPQDARSDLAIEKRRLTGC